MLRSTCNVEKKKKNYAVQFLYIRKKIYNLHKGDAVPLNYQHFYSKPNSRNTTLRNSSNLQTMGTFPEIVTSLKSSTFWCYDRKALAPSAQCFKLWQQATILITQQDHSIIACIQRNANREVATLVRCYSYTCGLFRLKKCFLSGKENLSAKNGKGC